MATDANIFVGHCHVCLSVADGQLDLTVQPTEDVVADPVGPLPMTEEGYCASRWIEAYPMKANTAESLLTAFLIFIW